VYRSTKLSAEEAGRAIAAAQEGTELSPGTNSGAWTHLGRAHYRAGNWKASLAALKNGPHGEEYNAAANRFFLAMAHWRLGEKEQAVKCYDDAVRWMDANKPNDSLLRHDRNEAKDLLNSTPTATTPE
jgi:tetratricopeptide (TPR) repeat protein